MIFVIFKNGIFFKVFLKKGDLGGLLVYLRIVGIVRIKIYYLKIYV